MYNFMQPDVVLLPLKNCDTLAAQKSRVILGALVCWIFAVKARSE